MTQILKQQVKHKIKCTYQSYITDLQQDIHGNIKKFWNFVDSNRKIKWATLYMSRME